MKRMLMHLLAAIFLIGMAPANAKDLRMAYQVDAVSMDSMTHWTGPTLLFIMNFYEPLLDFETDKGYFPKLALRWERVEPTRWRFWLRQGVKFHEGQPFTADDVVFSAKRLMSPRSTARTIMTGVTDVVKVDTYTVDFLTDSPNPRLINLFSAWPIFSKSWMEQHGSAEIPDIAKGESNYALLHANGTGPYRMESREPGVRTVATLFTDWWGDTKDRPTKVVASFIQNDATRTAALLSGQIDLIAPIAPQDVDRVSSASGFKVKTGIQALPSILGFDQFRDELLYSNIKGKNPFKDVRVRKAFYQAIDVDTIVAKVMRGRGEVATMISPPGAQGWDKSHNRLPFDLAAAKKLMIEAGYPDGFTVTLDCPSGAAINDAQICEAVSGMLARISVKVELLAQPPAKYNEKTRVKLDTSFFFFTWGHNGWSFYNTLRDIATCKSNPTQSSPNIGAYCNPKIDQIVQQAKALDPADEKKLTDQAAKILADDAAYIPLVLFPINYGMRSDVDIKIRSDGHPKWLNTTIR